MLTPVIDAKRREFPNAEHIMLSNDSEELIKPSVVYAGADLIDRYLYYKSGSRISLMKLAFKLRKENFAQLVYMVRDPEVRWQRDRKFFKLAGIKLIFGQQESKETHILDQLADRAGLKLSFENVRTSFNKLYFKTNSELQQVNNAVAIGMGGKKPFCRWPHDRYSELIETLIKRYDITPVYFGSKGEGSDAQKLIDQNSRGINFCGKLSIEQGLATMASCQTYIGNDTGTIHMAAAAGLRCLGLYASHDIPGKWHPYGQGHVVLRDDSTKCAGSLEKFVCPHDNECIESISVKQVLQAYEENFCEMN